MNQILYSKSKQRIKVLVILVFILLLLFLSFLGFGFYRASSDKILKNVQINSIDVGNMTVAEAQEKLNEAQKTLDSMTYLFVYENREIEVKGEEIHLAYPSGLVEKAYEYGKNGNIFENSLTAIKDLFHNVYSITVGIQLDEEALSEKLNVLLEEEKAKALNDTYEISGEKILVSKGHDGVVANVTSVAKKVLEKVGKKGISTRIEIDVDRQEAERIDFEKLYEEIYVEKKDASYTQKEDGTMEYVKEIIGVSFDKETVENEYLNLKDDEVLTINLVKETPNITTANLEDVLFGDRLSTFKTTYNASNVNRSTNLAVAAKNINGTILLPGEEFSYNKEVGERTYANGFKDAHIFSGGKVVDGLGGGICQISSTLYNAVLMANLEITERKNHMMYPEYVKPSLDATVVWGSIDFKFKNNRNTPIKIAASVKNGVATISIYGKKVAGEPIVQLESVVEKTIPYTTVTEYDAKMEEGKTVVTQTPVNGYVSKAYKILKDENGKEISRTLISSDSYRQTSKIITVGTKKVEKPVEPPVTSGNNGNEVQNNPENNENQQTPNKTEWPTGWDSPENPYYQGN